MVWKVTANGRGISLRGAAQDADQANRAYRQIGRVLTVHLEFHAFKMTRLMTERYQALSEHWKKMGGRGAPQFAQQGGQGGPLGRLTSQATFSSAGCAVIPSAWQTSRVRWGRFRV